MSLRQEWIDDRLAYGKMAQYSNYGLNSITLTEQERIWKPDLFFRNEKEGHFHKIILPNVLLRINGDGQVLYSIRISLVLACPMDLKYYPLDKQNCTIEMASYGYLDEDLKFVWKRENPVQIQKPLNLPRFTLETHETAYCTSRTTTGAYSCLRIDLIFKREFSYYLIQIYIPCCMLVIVSWVSFWLDPNAIPARVSLGVTTLLTMATQISGINASLPPVSYTKAIDVWTGVCLTFVFSALLEFALVNYASRSDQHKREMLTSALTYTQKMRWREATAAAAAAGVAPPTSPPPDENSPSAYTCTPKAPPNQIQATQPQGQATTSTSVTSAHHSANNANNTHFLFPDSQQQQHPAHLALGGPHPTSCNVGGQYQCAAFPRQAARTSGGAPASLHSQQQHPLGVCATVDAAGLAATHPPNGPPCLAPVRPYGLAHGQQTNNSSNRNQQQQRNFVPQTTQQPDSNKQPARSRAKSILSLVGFSRQRAPRAGGDPSSTNQHHPSHRSSWSSRPQSSKQRANSNQMLAGPQCPLHYQPVSIHPFIYSLCLCLFPIPSAFVCHSSNSLTLSGLASPVSRSRCCVMNNEPRAGKRVSSESSAGSTLERAMMILARPPHFSTFDFDWIRTPITLIIKRDEQPSHLITYPFHIVSISASIHSPFRIIF